ncbi:MAG: 3-deoxy-7-phosphoheptulonate synthase [Melioribacteraceae bacterium]|nr:3-deoxy-7-phosphoheptulonate synthase [Melioribacteraceae bacterium]MCF8355524.1 3-deoxy-7-phosphoheptulonate synthase [Melioribacteraceae bacterium]MCF8394521.1 3-deoxy-7-phosphoheptulonate synthase [Melioribacteraceae bacterium]MCF8420137.1 3-deoxy-7-phosphoheptulonate synthase [Melioribacteraceae bacterium]
MVVILENNATEEQIKNVEEHLHKYGFEIHKSIGAQRTILGAIGVQPNFDTRKIKILDGVSEVFRVTAPYKLASRSFQESNTVIKIKDVEIGANQIAMMSGPCSVESEEQIFKLAEVVAKSGAKILRGGAFKPRSSPYSFQGMGEDGLKLMRAAADQNNLLVITEVMQISQIDLINQYTDIFQIGARNMQNFPLLKELGKVDKPIMLKRGLSATIEEWLMSAEYILSAGNKDVMLCERGIRTFEKYTRNTFDLSSIPVVHKKSHLPVIADPSHATGLRDQVPAMARAAVAAGADGLMIEIHHDPENALSDGPQALLPDTYSKLFQELKLIAKAINRDI